MGDPEAREGECFADDKRECTDDEELGGENFARLGVAAIEERIVPEPYSLVNTRMRARRWRARRSRARHR